MSAHTIGPQTESAAAVASSADALDESDAVLLSRARLGDDSAFATLWQRNLPAAYGVATRFRGRVSAEDLVAEASARMFRLIREGSGPSENFRAYFTATVRTVGVDAVRSDMSVVPTPGTDLDRIPVSDSHLSALGAEGVDTDLVRAAFRQLSESDRQLLWHTMVEGEPPRVVAPLLGVSANVVSARAVRARDELRARYLDVWVQRRVPVCGAPECRWTLDHLGGHVRGRLTARQQARADDHLAGCSREAGLAVELRRVYDGFGVLTGPVVLAAGAAMAGTLQHGAIAGLIGSSAAGSTAAGAAAGAGA
ncbi:MAG: sigma-70 family RNA polymerase sigma factor, partial [Dermatophilaceae bacterium]|nr:sigma-70 family RNA polymerase sigma factor [Dermatophilaceae bacterium]